MLGTPTSPIPVPHTLRVPFALSVSVTALLLNLVSLKSALPGVQPVFPSVLPGVFKHCCLVCEH